MRSPSGSSVDQEREGARPDDAAAAPAACRRGDSLVEGSGLFVPSAPSLNRGVDWLLWRQPTGCSGSPTAVQGIEKTSIQCPSLPDLGSQSTRGFGDFRACVSFRKTARVPQFCGLVVLIGIGPDKQFPMKLQRFPFNGRVRPPLQP